MKKLIFSLTLVALCGLIFFGCIKQQFDAPKDLTHFDPNLNVNMKIRDLVSPYLGIGVTKYRILGDSILYGIVTADDHSGNFYKQIIIQDSTFGLDVAIDNSYLYNKYPIGRKVYIKTKGLYMMVYKGLPQICYGYNLTTQKPIGIPSTLEDSFIVAASFPNTVVPKEVRLSDLSNTNPYLNMLIKIDNMQFDSASNPGYPNLTYAKPSSIAISTPVYLTSCNSGSGSAGSLELYNSGYATFYNLQIPTGYGSITGIFGVYGSTPQFQIRDTSDVQFNQPRCH